MKEKLRPPPRQLQPTTKFDGCDGSWSTFFINIGGDGENVDKGQNFRVLPSTSSSFTVVPGIATWCNSQCAKQRGVEYFASSQPLGFEANSSTSWQEKGLFNIPLAENISLYPDANPNGTWGTDYIGLGQAGPDSVVLAEQMVVQSTSRDFYIGMFGLADISVNLGRANAASFLTNLDYYDQTASNSYGYTAGAYYRNHPEGVLGSLVLGGYDQSRFTDQNITVPFTKASDHSLIVGVQSITYHPDQSVDDNTISFTSNRPQFLAAIDSTLPYLWLPDDICDHFAQQLQLTYDRIRNLYIINETAYTNNKRLNATVVFQLTAGIETNPSVSISLPYAAFNHDTNHTTFGNATKYFPIKRSPAGVYVLGRTLLQEAYLIVDYEQGHFQVAPANFSTPMPQENLVSISQKYVFPDTGRTTYSGVIAGTVVGTLAAILITALALFFRRKNRQRHVIEDKQSHELDTDAQTNIKHGCRSELESGVLSSLELGMGAINEVESPPAELYSPPPEYGMPKDEYFDTCRTEGMIYELPGEVKGQRL